MIDRLIDTLIQGKSMLIEVGIEKRANDITIIVDLGRRGALRSRNLNIRKCPVLPHEAMVRGFLLSQDDKFPLSRRDY